jgi:ribosomal protein S12 methylthiotransferase accessory factor
MMLATQDPTPLDESLRRLETLVSKHTGVVRSLQRFLAATDDAPLVSVACELADSRDLIGADVDARAIAWAPSRRTATAAAIGEAAERYSASWLPDARLRLASSAELGAEAVDPERFALFGPEQYESLSFACRPFTRETRVRWARGVSLPDGVPAWLPAQLVYLTAIPPAAGETLVGYATSSGLACGPTLEEALAGALLEVVERDAFMLAWHARLSLPVFDLAGDAQLERFLERYVHPTGLQVSAVDLSVFHDIPTALALVRGNQEGDVALTVGAAAAARASNACIKAFGEAFACRAWARLLLAADPERQFEPDFADVADFEDHVHLYAMHEHAGKADFLDGSSVRRSPGDVPELPGQTATSQIEAVTERLARAGMTAYAVDVTAPDIRQAGLHVVRVLVPELCQLDLFHHGRFLGGRRLYEAAWWLGLRDRPLAPHEINPDPHPFP